MRKTPDRTLKLTRAGQMPDKTGKLMRASLSPDKTTRLPSGASLGGAQAATAFQWPAPPYYEFGDAAVPGAAAPCVLTFSDGAKAAGMLLDFSPQEALLRFRQDGAEATVTVSFSGLLRLELNAPVALRRQNLPASMERRVFAASTRQPFEVRLQNGEIRQGDTVGYIEALCGVFLFLPCDDDRVARCFIPAHAALDYSIGKPLGQMLVEEKLASAEVVDSAVLRQAALRSQRVGEYLTDNQIVSHEQLAVAIKRQQAQPVQMLGETLVELGYLSGAELKDALAIEERNRTLPLGQILADMGVIEPEVIHAVMARKLGIPFIDLHAFEIAPEILKRVPGNVAHRYQVVPLDESDKALVVAIDNPMDMAKMEDLRFIVGSKLIPVMASANDIRNALLKCYGPPGMLEASIARASEKDAELPRSRPSEAQAHIGDLTALLAAESAEIELDERHAVQNDTTLVKLVNKIILDAAEQKASDIHIEANPREQGDPRALPQGRRAHHLPGTARQVPPCRDFSNQDHEPARYHRAPAAAGRQDRIQPLRPGAGGTARGHHPDRKRPGGRGDARAVGRLAGGDRPARLRRRGARRRQAADVAAARAVPGVRPDRFGQDHDAAFAARPPEHGRAQDLDGRRPDRDRAIRPAASAGQCQARLDFCRRHAQLHARRPRRHHGGRDARRGDCQDRH